MAAACAVILAATPGHAKSQETMLLEPSSKWHLDMAEDKCRLARRFGEGENAHVLFFEQDQPSRFFSVIAAGPGFEKFGGKAPLQIAFGGAEPVSRESFTTGSLEGFGPTIFTYLTDTAGSEDLAADEEAEKTAEFVYLRQIDTDTLEKVDRLTLSQSDRPSVEFHTGKLSSPMEALNGCARNFIEFWGLDLEKHRKMKRRAEWTNTMQVIRRIQSSYPVAALRAGEQGIVRMLVIVDENGAVTECRQSDATLLDKLESNACREMRKATFKPALDADGKAMKSYYATRVRYSLPQ